MSFDLWVAGAMERSLTVDIPPVPTPSGLYSAAQTPVPASILSPSLLAPSGLPASTPIPPTSTPGPVPVSTPEPGEGN